MAQYSLKDSWFLYIPSPMMVDLEAHLFPGDHDEHGAVLGASVVKTSRGVRLLATKLFIANESVDYLPGDNSYRRLSPEFVHKCIDYCAEERLAYIAVHCHGGHNEVKFSETDLGSHERSYPALLDILDGLPVIGLVFASGAAAGDVWLNDRSRRSLKNVKVIGRPLRTIYPSLQSTSSMEAIYNRQSLIFGEAGQGLLKAQKVGIIGAGGVGSLIGEYLSRLGVGHIAMVDPDRIAPSNIPRVVGSTQKDVLWLKNDEHIKFIPRFLFKPKIKIAQRVAKKANPKIKFQPIFKNVTDPRTAAGLIDCDYLFLAADTMQARLVFNAIVNQYLVPGSEVGTKVSIDPKTHHITDIYSAYRPITPGSGCLWCNDMINSSQLNEEAKTESQRQKQRYLNDEMIHAPSVITLNAVAASHAVDDYLFSFMGMLKSDQGFPWSIFHPLETEPLQRVRSESLRKDQKCSECGQRGRLAKGNKVRLPTKFAG